MKANFFSWFYLCYKQSHNAGDLYYAAVGLKRSSDPGNEEKQYEENVCIYSRIKTVK